MTILFEKRSGMVKFWKRAGIATLCLVCLYGIYYGSYRLYLYKVGNADKLKFEKQEKVYSAEVNNSGKHTITQRTKLIIEHYNRVDESVVEEAAAMPVEYIGMTREALTEYLSEYSRAPSLQDVMDGFEKYQILSFSDSQVVLRKIFVPAGTEYKFYLTEENGCVTVYYIDLRTVYEYTNIVVDGLPDDIKEQVQRGKYVTDEDALYDFLETYTS